MRALPLRARGGDVGIHVWRVGQESFRSEVDVQSVRHWLHGLKDYPEIDLVMHVLDRDVPVDVQPCKDFVNELGYGNHSGVDDHQDRSYMSNRACMLKTVARL